jgi:hypothetical protein
MENTSLTPFSTRAINNVSITNDSSRNNDANNTVASSITQPPRSVNVRHPVNGDNADADDHIAAIRLLAIKNEKELLPLLPDKSVRRILKKKQSKDWLNFFLYIDIQKFLALYHTDSTITDPDDKVIRKNYEGFDKISRKGKDLEQLDTFSYLVCKECFESNGTPLKTAAFACGSTGTSNYNIHLKTNHTNMCLKRYRSIHLEKPPSSSPSTMSASQTTPRNPLGFVSIASKKKQTAKSLIEDAHTAMYNFINDCNLSATTVIKDNFREMVEAIRLAGMHCSKDDLIIGKLKYQNLQCGSLANTVFQIYRIVGRARSFYIFTTGNTIGFLCICHDVWDGKQRESLGIAITFVCPIDCTYYQFPLGLINTASKKADQVCAEALKVLSRYGIHQTDLYRPVNDNTNCALKAGRLIVNTEISGKCGMHEADLITKHATGQVVRTRGRLVVDSFPTCENFRSKIRDMVRWLVDRKAKTRFPLYHTFVHDKLKFKAIRLTLPNKTRVAGTIIMYRDCLRSCSCLSHFFQSSVCPPEFKNHALSKVEWDQLAQFTCILEPIYSLSLALQTDKPAAIAISYIQIGTALYSLKQHRTGSPLMVVETRQEHWWGPEVKYSELPRCKRYYCGQPSDFGVGSFISEASCKLIDRLIKETENYFGNKVSRDRDIAIMCHPFTAVHGLDCMQLIGWIDDAQKTKYTKILIDTVFNFHKKVPETTTTSGTDNDSNVITTVDSDSDNEEDTPPSNGVIQATDIFKRAYKKAKTRTGATTEQHRNNPTNDVNTRMKKDARDQVKDYLELVEGLDWASIISTYPTPDFHKYQAETRKKSRNNPRLKKELNDWCKYRDIISLWKFFNVLQWWHTYGRVKYPLIFPVACVSLGKPYTNAAQERNFSLASWFNCILMQSSKDVTFEIRCIEALNRSSLKSAKMSIAEHIKDYPAPEISDRSRVSALANFCEPAPVTPPIGRVATIFGRDGEVIGHSAPVDTDSDSGDQTQEEDDDDSYFANLDDENFGWGPEPEDVTNDRNTEVQLDFLQTYLGNYNTYMEENNVD